MKFIFTALFLILLSTSTFAQVTQNFDTSICNSSVGCWQRFFYEDIGCNIYNPPIAYNNPLCIAGSINTATPINGTGSLRVEEHFPVGGCPDRAFTGFNTSIYGVNGSIVSFKVRLTTADFSPPSPSCMLCGPGWLTIGVMYGRNFYNSTQYNPDSVGKTITIIDTLDLAPGEQQPVMVWMDRATDIYTYGFNMVLDFDDLTVTNGVYIPVANCVFTLPIKLVDFTSTNNNCKTNLHWKTAYEQNINRFELQKSSNGTSFTTICNVLSSKNTAGSTYQYTDSNNSSYGYYRLLAVDNDGRKEYSSVIRQKGCAYNNQISIYPNPAKDVLHIDGLKMGNIVRVLNALGQVVITQKATGDNMLIQINKLPEGIYNVSIPDAKTGQIVTNKFYKK